MKEGTQKGEGKTSRGRGGVSSKPEEDISRRAQSTEVGVAWSSGGNGCDEDVGCVGCGW